MALPPEGRRRSLASCSAMYCRWSSNTSLSFPAALRLMRRRSYICRSQRGQDGSAVVAALSTARGSLGKRVLSPETEAAGAC